jgi:hypothetical protein
MKSQKKMKVKHHLKKGVRIMFHLFGKAEKISTCYTTFYQAAKQKNVFKKN